MEDFKGSVHDYCGWSMKQWQEEEKRKKVVFNSPFTDETLCVFVGGRYDGKVMSVKELKEREECGKRHDYSGVRKFGYPDTPYTILDNAPLVQGYLAPMAGTSGCPLRYETFEIYNQLSR